MVTDAGFRGPWFRDVEARGWDWVGRIRNRGNSKFATLEWVDWFKHRQLLEPIGNRPPVEAEAAYHRQLEHTALAA